MISRFCHRAASFRFGRMAFVRRWFLVSFALVLGGGQLFAASREERAYAAAVAAFHDHIYDRAETSLTQFLQSYRKSTNAPSATLLLAQSEFYLGKYPAAIARLGDTNNFARAQSAGLADAYLYWRAEAQFARGNSAHAAQTFVSLANDYPKSPFALSAVVEAAAAYGKLGQWPQADALLDDTNGLFQRAAQLDPSRETVANGRLLQSESRCAQNNFDGAIRILNLLNPATLTPEQDWQRAHQLYRAYFHLGELDAALAAATNLLGIARAGQGGAWAANLAESVSDHAGVLEKQGRLDEARAAWRENLTNNVPAELQRRAILKMAELAEARNDLSGAEADLDQFLGRFSNSPAADLARLTLGELHLKDFIAAPAATNHLAAAQTNLLAVAANGPLAGKAFLDRGWCHWLAQQYPESFDDFQSAAERLPASDDLAVARFKMGDAQFVLTNYAGALTNYEAVLDFSGLTNVVSFLGDHALYQILRARLALHDTGGMDGTMSQLLARFFTNAPAENSRSLEKFFMGAPADSSLLLAESGSPAQTRQAFLEFETERADSPLRPQVAFAVGRTFERERNWPAAATNYQTWLQTYPTNDLRPQVEYACAWAVAMTGNEAGAFEWFTKLVNHFPDNATFMPLAHWWLADHYFRLGDTNFTAAEGNYELIFQDYPTNELAGPARLMAGRAAMGRFNYKDAAGYFEKLINNSNCVEELRIKAKFGYCEALRELAASDTNASLQTATNVLAQICPAAATNLAGALAWSELGDCDLQLGALDAATNAYAQAILFSAAHTNDELLCRAKVGLGLALEKKAEGLPDDDRKNLLKQALNLYLDVVDMKSDEFWVQKAGLQALPNLSLIEGDTARQRFLDRLEQLLPQMKDALEKKRNAPASF